MISLVVPCYSLTETLEEMAIICALSYRDQVEELIVVEDGGRYSKELQEIADVYIYNKHNKGFSVNVNRGWKNAMGDFVMIASSDTSLIEGNLTDLCIPGKVTSPEIDNQFIDYLAGPFFVVPKEITKERGYLREEMRTYSSDSEYDNRVRDVFQKVPSVHIFHAQAQSVTQAGVEGGAEQQRDREAYQKLIDEGKAK